MYANAFFGQGTGPIFLDDLRCTGTETRLVDCPSNGIGISNHCNGHADDAGVQCQPRKDFVLFLGHNFCSAVYSTAYERKTSD